MRSFALILMLFACAGSLRAASQAKNPAKEHDTCAAHATVRVPKHTIVRRLKLNEGRWLQLFVSVDPTRTNREDLIALGCALGRKFASKEGISAWILSDDDAARHYNPQGEGNSRAMVAALQGNYGFARDKDLTGQILSIRTDPNSSYLNVEIDLGPPPEVNSSRK